MSTDTPILRADIRDMSQADYESWLTAVRERQMANRRRYEDVERAKSLARVDKLSPKYEAKLARIRKKMDKIDADIQKISDLMNEASTFRQEIEIELRLSGSDHPELKLQRPGEGEGSSNQAAGDPIDHVGSEEEDAE